MEERDFSKLKRPRQPMPGFVEEALTARDLMDAYRQRPPYQQNDYVGWITRARRPETTERRLAQMLDELESGDRYMKMPYGPGSGGESASAPRRSGSTPSKPAGPAAKGGDEP